MTQKAELEPLRSLGFGSISGTYAVVGTATNNPTKIICITNNTAGDMIFSRDNTVAEGELFLAAGSFKLFDITTNSRPVNTDDTVFRKGTQWYVKQDTAPVSGSVYIELLYAE